MNMIGDWIGVIIGITFVAFLIIPLVIKAANLPFERKDGDDDHA